MGRGVWNGGLNPPGLVVDGMVEVSGRVSGAVGRCPDCGTPSSSCHSRYEWTLSDLPISSAIVKLRLKVRRFRCNLRSCRRKTHREALAPNIGRRHGRRVARCDSLMRAIGLALGERPGSRMMARLAVPWSKDTLLQTVRREAAVRSEMPRLRKALSPEKPVNPETFSKSARLRWEASVTREAVNSQILALAAQGTPLKAMARTTGISRQTPPGLSAVSAMMFSALGRAHSTPGRFGSKLNGPAVITLARKYGAGYARRVSPVRCES